MAYAVGWELVNRYYHRKRVEFEIRGCKLAEEERT